MEETLEQQLWHIRADASIWLRILKTLPEEVLEFWNPTLKGGDSGISSISGRCLSTEGALSWADIYASLSGSVWKVTGCDCSPERHAGIDFAIQHIRAAIFRYIEDPGDEVHTYYHEEGPWTTQYIPYVHTLVDGHGHRHNACSDEARILALLYNVAGGYNRPEAAGLLADLLRLFSERDAKRKDLEDELARLRREG